MGAFRKAALGTIGAGLITAGVATMAAPHGSDYINGRIEEGVQSKPWYTFMISKKDARKIGNKRLKRAIGKPAYSIHRDISRNPLFDTVFIPNFKIAAGTPHVTGSRTSDVFLSIVILCDHRNLDGICVRDR